MENLTKFLSNLNPQRAFGLFFSSLLVGTILIFGGWWKPFGPAIPVLAYGILLVIVQHRYFVQLAPNLKDSPYFLGFILTLFEILDVVLIGFPQQSNSIFLFDEIGAAILTTAVGLLMRQVLLATDHAEEAQDRIFRTIAEEVRRDTLDFHNTQQVFVRLVKEFVQTREEMFSTEEKTFGEYVKALKDGALRLGALPKRVETVLSALDGSGTRIAEISSKLEDGLSNVAGQLSHDVDNIAIAVAASRKHLDDEIFSIAKAIESVCTQIVGFQSVVGQGTSSTDQAARTVSKSLGELSTGIDEVGRRIVSLSSDLDRVAGDIRGIDNITGDLIRILRERLTIFADAFQRERSL